MLLLRDVLSLQNMQAQNYFIVTSINLVSLEVVTCIVALFYVAKKPCMHRQLPALLSSVRILDANIQQVAIHQVSICLCQVSCMQMILLFLKLKGNFLVKSYLTLIACEHQLESEWYCSVTYCAHIAREGFLIL